MGSVPDRDAVDPHTTSGTRPMRASDQDRTEAVLALTEAVVGDRERSARGFRALGYYLMGAALDETSGYALGPSAAEPVDDAYIAEHCPRLAAAAPYFGQAHWDRTFALGLAALIDGMRNAPR